MSDAFRCHDQSAGKRPERPVIILVATIAI
jgi:hypothetical protein